MEQCREFTWFEKLTRVLNTIPDELKGQWTVAVINYGTLCVEPSFEDWGLVAAFEGVRDDIDRSANARSNNKGGRPKADEAETEKTGGYDDSENLPKPPNGKGYCDSENLPKPPNGKGYCDSENLQEPPVSTCSETSNNPPSNKGKGKGIGKDIGRDRGRGGGTGEEKRKRFKPPSLNEVQDFITANNLNVEADRFIDYYTSNGWKVGRGNPMKDWRSAVRNWSRRNEEKRKDKDDVSETLKQAAEFL